MLSGQLYGSYGFLAIENVSHVYQYTHLVQTKHRNHLGQTCADSLQQFHFVHLSRSSTSEATLRDRYVTLSLSPGCLRSKGMKTHRSGMVWSLRIRMRVFALGHCLILPSRVATL